MRREGGVEGSEVELECEESREEMEELSSAAAS